MAIGWYPEVKNHWIGWAFALVGTFAIGGCASAPETAPTEVLDEVSAVTLIVVRHPIVLARARTDLAVNARDYLTLVAAREDRSGKYTTWLVAHRWSTLDQRMDADNAGGSPDELHLFADGREVRLSADHELPLALKRGDLLFAPHRAVESTIAYHIDLPTLRYLAASKALSARFAGDTVGVPYSMWDDGRQSLEALVRDATP
jgi:hypothetical protein